MDVTGEETAAAQAGQTDVAQETSGEDTAAQTAAEPQITLDFSEDTVLQTPVSGQILIPYNMENTVYFPTLNVYKCNPSVVIASEVGTQVAAVANSQVKSISNDAQTGLTVTMDMGNGYEAVYGQLQDVSLEEGAMVQAGEIIGTIAEPTKYYTEEGSNLYFALTKDGQTIDPTLYLPPQAE
ncbi:M23 family metallopeptidase [Lacrimispora saccharolytica]|nr:M23 family metallopeptidase [Lacrimispora saccharolytica]